MANLTIETRDIPGASDARLSIMAGAIDASTVTEFQGTLDKLRSEGVRRLVLDLSGVKYVNSTGLGSLVKYADSFKQSGGGVALVRVPPKVKIVIEMLGLHAFFVIETGVQPALAAMGGGDAVASPPPAATPVISPPAAPQPPPPRYASPARPPATRAPAPTPAVTVPPPAATGPSLPLRVACQTCQVELEIQAVGNFRCPRCQTLLALGTDGRVRFFGQEKQASMSLSLVTSPECAEGLKAFVSGVARRMAFQPSAVTELESAVLEICHVLRTRAHGGKATEPFHVLITPDGAGLRLHVSTHGEDLGNGEAFPRTRSVADEFDLRRHPAGGSLLRMVKNKQ